MCGATFEEAIATPVKLTNPPSLVAASAVAIMSTPPAPEKKIVLTISEEVAKVLAFALFQSVSFASNTLGEAALATYEALKSQGIDYDGTFEKDYASYISATRDYRAGPQGKISATAETVYGPALDAVRLGVTLTLDEPTANELRMISAVIDGPGIDKVFEALQDAGFERDWSIDLDDNTVTHNID